LFKETELSRKSIKLLIRKSLIIHPVLNLRAWTLNIEKVRVYLKPPTKTRKKEKGPRIRTKLRALNILNLRVRVASIVQNPKIYRTALWIL